MQPDPFAVDQTIREEVGCEPDPAPDADLLAQLVADFDATETGDYFPASDAEARLCRILRHRGRIESELERAKQNMKAVVAGLISQLYAHSWQYQKEAEALTREILGSSKRKTVTTPWGKAGFRKSPARLEVLQEGLVPEEFIREKIVRSVDKAALNDRFKREGEIIDGCELIPEHDNFYMG